MSGPGTTPGPWSARKFRHQTEPDELLVIGPKGEVLATLYPQPQARANAHLIAAAPDLYAALFCPDSMHGGPHRGDGERCGLCRQSLYDIEADQFEALAKARGEVSA